MANDVIKVFLIVVYALSMFFYSRTLACECVSKESRFIYNDFKRMSFIFIGTVKNITTTWRDGGTGASRDVQFQANKFIKKPANFNNDSVIIYTPKDRSACGVKMKLNERWQIWAEYSNFFSEDDVPRWLTVISCGRSTKNLKQNAYLLRRWSVILPM
jgi:hypothetical protein